MAGYEKLVQTIRNTQLPEGEAFYEVFPDLNYYPGKRVAKMVAQQIGPSRVYLPMINTLGRDFQIMPLHHNLAEAMGASFFLYGTTFDNRQWMDIRGVGSGATGIEYIERGSHWERQVVTHEYTHLYHGSILTYKESRKIRSLYYAAMRNHRILDYYSKNNVSEFFAQAYEAYLSEKKVHPLTHKSMNTRAYLRKKDSTLHAFVESLVQKQKAYLAGNESVMKSNWAQTYVTLSQRYQRQPQKAIKYLEKALGYDKNYLPALLLYAEIQAEAGRFKDALAWIGKAKKVDSKYGPIYSTKAYIFHQKALQGEMDFETSIKKQSALFKKALKLEHDLSVQARITRIFRRRNLQYGRIAKAIEVAKQYLQDAPTISTYLRDHKEETQAFVKWWYSRLGHPANAVDFFEELVAQNPQQFRFRVMYADVLSNAHKYEKALNVLREGHRILAAAGNPRPAYTLRIARTYLKQGDTANAQKWIDKIEKEKLNSRQKQDLAVLMAKMDHLEVALSLLPSKKKARLPFEKGAWYYTTAFLTEVQGNNQKAINYYQNALQWNPYNLQARKALIQLLKASGKKERVKEVKNQAKQLSI